MIASHRKLLRREILTEVLPDQVQPKPGMTEQSGKRVPQAIRNTVMDKHSPSDSMITARVQNRAPPSDGLH